MNVDVGQSARYGRFSQDPPTHLIVEVGGRKVLACTGGAVNEPRALDFDQALAELDCAPCRKFWKSAMKVNRQD